MRNVAGLSTSEAQKSSDMFGKCRYLDEITGGRGVVFATGTPVSNSMSELYTVMRYLQYGTLQQKGLTHFDCWASTFGETTTAIELAPEGTGYRARTRFAKFFNLPELMSMFKEVADIKTSDQLHLPVPDAKFETVVAKPSEIQKEMVQELSKRAAKIHSGAVDASEDNMLCVTNDGRKIGLDVRLMNPILPDDPNSKLMLSKRQYELSTGRRQKNDVIAYQIRQSFKPGEITAEEANKVGYELAMRFTKGKYAFIVATHTDRHHIHNHVIFNSTALDGSKKFRDFFFSALAVQRLSDLICLEHQLSVIEIKPYRERQKRTLYPPKESNRDRLCGIIDSILAEKPKDYEDFLQKLEQQGYEVKRGKYTSVKGAR